MMSAGREVGEQQSKQQFRFEIGTTAATQVWDWGNLRENKSGLLPLPPQTSPESQVHSVACMAVAASCTCTCTCTCDIRWVSLSHTACSNQHLDGDEAQRAGCGAHRCSSDSREMLGMVSAQQPRQRQASQARPHRLASVCPHRLERVVCVCI